MKIAGAAMLTYEQHEKAKLVESIVELLETRDNDYLTGFLRALERRVRGEHKKRRPVLRLVSWEHAGGS